MNLKNFKPTISNIIFEWKTLPKSVIDFGSEGVQRDREAEINLFPKVLARGPDCKTVEIGDYVAMNVNNFSILTIDGVPYGIVKEHQVDIAFKEKPAIMTKLEGDEITVQKTGKKVQDFQERARKNNLKL